MFKYALIRTKPVGGPATASINIEKMLKRYADFEFEIIKTNQAHYFKNVDKKTIVHIQTTMPLLEKAINKGFSIIAGPNVKWKKTKSEVKKSTSIRRILTVRPDPAPRKCNPKWSQITSLFPPFIDETFFVPVNCKKNIDILTISKSFHYREYNQNTNQFIKLLKPYKFKHIHLGRYDLSQFRDKLSKTKVLVFLSPKEASVCCCHALLEANIMNVPFLVLDRLIPKDKNPDEFHVCRGESASTIKEVLKILPSIVENYQAYKPRSWVIERYSFEPAYKRLYNILKLV